jgi:hypothetical protein
MNFLGAHESSESKSGDIFHHRTLLFPSLTVHFLWEDPKIKPPLKSGPINKQKGFLTDLCAYCVHLAGLMRMIFRLGFVQYLHSTIKLQIEVPC